MNLVHVADAIPSSSPFPCATGSLVRYSNPIWRLIEQASEHEDLFDDVISNHILPNDVAGIARRALGSSSDLRPFVYYRTIPSQAREVQRFFAPKLFHLHSFLTMLGGLLSGWAEKIADVTARVTHPTPCTFSVSPSPPSPRFHPLSLPIPS